MSKNHPPDALQEAYDRLRFSHEASGGYLWEITPEGIYTYVSDEVMQVKGHPASSFIGHSPFEFMPPEEVPEVQRIVQEAVQSRSRFQLIHSDIAANGEILWEEVKGIVKVDAAGQVIGLYGSSVPINDRIRMERELREITARHEVEMARRDEQSHLDKIAAHVPGMLYQFRLNADGGYSIPYASNFLFQLFPVTPDELRGDVNSLFRNVHPDDAADFTASILQSARNLTPWQQDFRVLLVDGRVRWLSGESMPQREPDGGTLWHGFMTDITERRQNEEGWQLARQIFDTAREAIFVYDLDGRLLDVNTEACRLAKYRREDILRLRNTDIVTLSEHAPRIAPDLARHDVAAAESHWRLLCADGTTVPLALVVQRLPGDRYLAIGRDITAQLAAEQALRESERRFRDIAEISADWIWEVDACGRYTFASESVKPLLGYEPADIVGKTPFDLMPPEEAAHAGATFAAIVRRGDVFHDLENIVLDAQGRLHDTLTSGTPIHNAEGQLTGYRGVDRDITAQKQAAALARQRDEAERANAAKTEFLSRMSHELRTPLNAILGFSQLLMRDEDHPLHAAQADKVQEILHAGHHLLSLVNEVLDLARIESGHLSVSLEPVAVAPLVLACTTQIEPLAARQDIVVATHVGTGLAVLADHTRLKQVLLNLLSNAIKYNRDHGRVDVNVIPHDDRLRVEVRDTGCGIAPEHQGRLFKAFERLESAQSVEGTGVGLALAKNLVEAMGGQIGVSSTPGEGSTFWFDLPAAALPADDVPPPAHAPAGPALASGTVAATRRLKVLYIEDNVVNMKLVQNILRARPEMSFVGADSGESGLTAARCEAPGLILLDIGLPDIDGFEVLRRLRTDRATQAIPVIALSANAMQRDIAMAREAGFADYLTKPIKIDHLLRTLDRYLEGLEKG